MIDKFFSWFFGKIDDWSNWIYDRFIDDRPKKPKKKSTVNKSGNYTKPALRKRIFNRIMAGSKGGKPGQWSARKAQLLAVAYKKAGGGYKTKKA